MLVTRRFAASLLPVALILAGCGAANNVARPTALAAGGTVAAKAVAPDDPKVLAEDARRAQYWADAYGGPANLVMSIQTTALNSQALSASANVFFSPEAYYMNKPCVFVARHYFTRLLGRDTVSQDTAANKWANKLKPLPLTEADPRPGTTAKFIGPGWTVKTAAAWTAAHVVQADPKAPAAPAKRFFSSSRAILIQPLKGVVGGDTAMAWHLYADSQKFVIDATTGEVSPPTPAVSANDKLNDGNDAEMQRASVLWLPINPMEANNQPDPS